MEAMVKINIKKLHPDAVIPAYTFTGDGALDLTTVDDGDDKGSREFIEYRTGLAFEIPEGYVGLLFPRSSISRYRLSLANSVGVLDAGFRGEVTFRFRMLSETPSLRYKKGDRIGQIMVIPRPFVVPVEVEELSGSDRGGGGYGSSGA